jgi:hypothetical protein
LEAWDQHSGRHWVWVQHSVHTGRRTRRHSVHHRRRTRSWLGGGAYSAELGAPWATSWDCCLREPLRLTGRCTGNGAGRRTGPDARSDARSALGEALGTAAGQTLSLRDELGASLGASSPSTVGENSGRSWELLGRPTERQRTSAFTGRELGLHWGSDPELGEELGAALGPALGEQDQNWAKASGTELELN